MVSSTRAARTGEIGYVGLGLALLSAAAFGLSGPVARALLDAGWSAGLVTLLRISGAAVLVAVPTTLVLIGSRTQLRSWAPVLLAYGVGPIAGTQLCFFSAIQYLPVSTALLIEYLAPVLLMGWTWARTRLAPSATVLAGASVAVCGLVIVLQAWRGTVHPVGLAWALAASVCLASYFALAVRPGPRPPALVLIGCGLLVGALTIGAAGLIGIIALVPGERTVRFLGVSTSWVLPAVVLALVCTAIAYGVGVVAVRRLGSRTASFVSITEVLFAILASWALLRERPAPVQALGAVVVVAGVLLVQSRQRDPAPDQPDPLPHTDPPGR